MDRLHPHEEAPGHDRREAGPTDEIGGCCLHRALRDLAVRRPVTTVVAIGSGGDIQPVLPFAANLHDRDQWQAQIADLLEQAMERGLIGDRAAKDGRSIALMGEAQPVEPGGPSGLEAALEADLVSSGLLRTDSRCGWLTHGAPTLVGLITR